MGLAYSTTEGSSTTTVATTDKSLENTTKTSSSNSSGSSGDKAKTPNTIGILQLVLPDGSVITPDSAGSVKLSGTVNQLNYSASGSSGVNLAVPDFYVFGTYGGSGGGTLFGGDSGINIETPTGEINLNAAGAPVTIYSAACNISNPDGLSLTQHNSKLSIASGAPNDFIGQTYLNAGSATVSHTGVVPTDQIILSRFDLNESVELGHLVAIITPYEGFTITSYTSGAEIADNDFSGVQYFIVRQIAPGDVSKRTQAYTKARQARLDKLAKNKDDKRQEKNQEIK